MYAGIATENTSNFGASSKIESKVPSEDRYAALKDLDCQMKSQMMEKQQEEMKQKLGENLDFAKYAKTGREGFTIHSTESYSRSNFSDVSPHDPNEEKIDRRHFQFISSPLSPY